ncbi:MAG: hypothetical protein QOC55_135, partial [Thermoleophilaceae bacterium]|nr:hypothetical protein [Thermoleophilaceae bacterium]
MTSTDPTQRFLAVLALVAGALALLAPSPAVAADRGNPEIVVYRHQVANAPGQTRAREHSLGFTATHSYRHALEGFSARLTAGQVATLREDPDVAAVVPDATVRAESAPLAAGETLPTGVQRIGAGRAGSVRGASDVGVAVLDTGIDLSNPDLNVDAGTNCVGDGPPGDDNGHGTHVAGTIGARNDGSGVVGVAPGTKLYAVKVLGANGAGSTSSLICGLDWVLAHAAGLDIRVANMSLGSPGSLGNCQTDPERAAICALTAAGVTVVAAAGNERDAITSANHGHVPAGYPEVLAATSVADTDGQPGGSGGACGDVPDDAADDFSNYAATPADAAHTIAAPGGCIVSDAVGGGTATLSGTSMASAHVAGAAALCLDEDGAPGPCADMTPPRIIAELRQVAQDGATLSNGFDGDPLHAGLRYYGYLVRAGQPPGVTTAPATAVDETAATLPGTVTAHGLPAQWWAELGTTTDYGITTPKEAGDLGDAAADVQALATDLDPGTTYHYRLATMVDGWTMHGGDMTFTTPGTPPPPPPDTLMTAAPPAFSTSDEVQITFVGDPIAAVTAYQCRLDTDPWSPCASPAGYQGLADG